MVFELVIQCSDNPRATRTHERDWLLTILTMIQLFPVFLAFPPGGGKLSVCPGKKFKSARIAFYWLPIQGDFSMKVGHLFQLVVAFVAVLTGSAGQVQAATITTLFAENNALINGGAVYFDINVLNPAGITIKKLFTNTYESFVLANMDVYTRSGTSSGFQTSLSGWTLVSSGLGNSAGRNNPSEFDVTDFSLGVGVTGIAIVSSSAWGHSYTNGNGTNQFYSNSDLSLTLGSAKAVPFVSGPTFSPRVWNGTIEYNVTSGAVPEPTSLAIFVIGACVSGIGAARRRLRVK